MSEMGMLLIFVGFAVVVSLVIWLPYNYFTQRKYRAYLEPIGATLGLELDPRFFRTSRLIGGRRGSSIAIYPKMRGSKSNRKLFTAIDVGLPISVPEDLVIAHEGVLDTLAHKIGVQQDLDMVHEEFDDAFVVQGDDEKRLRQFIHKGAIADELIELHKSYPHHFRIRDRRLHVEIFGQPSIDEIEECLDDVIACVDTIRREAGGSLNPKESEPKAPSDAVTTEDWL